MAEYRLIHALPLRLRYRIKSLRYESDVALLKNRLETLDGVQDARVNLRSKSIVIALREPDARTEVETLLEHFDFAQEYLHEHTTCKIERGESKVSIRGLATVGAATALTPVLPRQLQMPLSVGINTPMMIDGTKELFREGVTSHVLETLAVGVSLLRRDYTAANITHLLLELGEYIEATTSQESDALLRELIKPTVEKVWIDDKGEEKLIAYDRVCVGDIVIVGMGDMISVDGHIVEGEALINQASMTGESVSVIKKYADRVIAGTVVEEGRIKIWAEYVGDDTSAARVSRYIEESLSTKSASALRASKLADKLVPITLGLSGFALLTTGDWERVASVLQADYSCALKLATPVAFKSALHKAGKHGITIKNAQALENLSEVDTVVFDKTGTLTRGELYVTQVMSFNEQWSEDDILALAASAEEHYFHPVAEAVVRAAREHSLDHIHHEEVDFIVAHGVTTEVEGKKVHIGSRHYLEEDEKIDFNGHHKLIDLCLDHGKTLLFIGYDYTLLGMIVMVDEIRRNAQTTIERLHGLGVNEIIMLTGDTRVKAEEVAAELGIDTVHAELLPTQKGDIVKELIAQGRKLLFVGDGINDAPALVEATVGISMNKGAEIARASADIALLVDDVAAVADAKQLAMDTMRLIDRNYKFTVAANSAILGAATLGVLKPVTTALLHNGTTVAILLNAIKGSATDINTA